MCALQNAHMACHSPAYVSSPHSIILPHADPLRDHQVLPNLPTATSLGLFQSVLSPTPSSQSFCTSSPLPRTLFCPVCAPWTPSHHQLWAGTHFWREAPTLALKVPQRTFSRHHVALQLLHWLLGHAAITACPTWLPQRTDLYLEWYYLLMCSGAVSLLQKNEVGLCPVYCCGPGPGTGKGLNKIWRCMLPLPGQGAAAKGL